MRTPIRESRFANRREAGMMLADKLREYGGREDVIVLALPRGGVPVGYEVARAIGAPLDVFIVRKIGVPFQPELAMGAVAAGGVRVLNQDVLAQLDITEAEIDHAAAEAMREVERRDAVYREGRPRPDLRRQTVIVVDDGLATGATMRAAVQSIRRLGAARIVVAVPVAAAETAETMAREVDRLVCLLTPEPFYAIGLWYEDFAQVDDDDVRTLLKRADVEHGAHH